MLKFKDLLIEARLAPLYHGTHIMYASMILDQNKIEVRPSHGGHSKIVKNYDNRIHGNKKTSNNHQRTISLTRDIDVAKNYSGHKTICFELDQLKLSQNYTISPINIENYWNNLKDRHAKSDYLREEYVTKDIYPLNKYLVKVICDYKEIVKEENEFNFNIFKHPLLWDYKTKKFINA